MTHRRAIGDFARKEDGSLLIFFSVCIIAILGIVALSFDMGRRASTQTDMQSYADNVALAAAGELDGQPDSITRARAAAQTAINAANETLKAGASGTTATLTFNVNTDLIFYSTLPATDAPGSFTVANLEASKYTLPSTGTTTDPTAAVYVGVRLNTVNVDWLFGNIFGSGNLPSAAVGAVAVAGNTAFTCDVAPLMFCLPRNPSGATVFPSVGDAVQLQTVGQGADWFPGNFGFLDVSWLAANAAASPCAGLTPESRFQACLLARGISACFNSRDVDVQTGQRTGQEAASFNLPFGFVRGSMNGMFNGRNAEPISLYAAGPHTVSGIEANGGCNNFSPSEFTPPGTTTAIPLSMPFPLDDCHNTNSCPNGRFGNGNWSTNRTTYVNTNYTEYDNAGNVVTAGNFFDFPTTNMTRYQYYQREIERASNGGVMSQYSGPQYQIDATPSVQGDTWDDYWPNPPTNGFNPIIPHNDRNDNGLAQCSLPNSANVERRVVIAAGIDCPDGSDPTRPRYSGTIPANVPVAQYYRVFLLAPARDVPGTSTGPGNQGSISQIDVEIVEAVGGNAGASTVDNGIFREVIQLYK